MPNELADFIRARREQLTPADVGLRDSGRRRTPGLRREEVAALAGVSIDYLIRLEQGRDSNPSASVLNAIAGALRLSEAERMHLLKLAHVTATPELCPEFRAARTVAPTIRLLLDRLDPTPAFVIGPYFDVLGWNPAWERLMAPVGMFDDGDPNLARFTFLHPAARRAYPDWSATADEQASTMRWMSLAYGDDARFQALLADLQQVDAFASRWAAHAVVQKQRGVKRIEHPVVGEVRIAYEVLALPDGDGAQLVTWLPADDAADDAIRRAIQPAAGLRAV
jgi:transcriptional regulator with XRE-family HTH domain